MKSQNIVISVLVLLVIGGGIYFFSTQNKKNQQSVVPTEAVQQEERAVKTSVTSESGVMEDINEIVINGSNFKFDPSTITVKKGQKTRVIFKNTQGMHNFKVDEFNISIPVTKTGEEQSAEFTADKAGTFEFYCSVEQHRAMGMKGTLVVE